MAYLWKYDWWPYISDYDARDLVQDRELNTTVTVSATPPPPSSFPTDWSPESTDNTPPELIVPPLPPPDVPHPGVGPVYRERFGDIVDGELVNPVVVMNGGGGGTPDFVMCELVPSIPGSGLTPCEILTSYTGDTLTLSAADAAAIWGEVRPGGPTSPLGPVYYVVHFFTGVDGGDSAAEGCARPGWTVVDPVCGPEDTATINTLDVSGGTGLWFDLPDDGNPAVLHQQHHGAKAMPGRIGNWAGQSYVTFEGYMINPTPHPEVIDHRGEDGFLIRPNVPSLGHQSAYEIPYECYFTWDELVAIPDVVVHSTSISHHRPSAGSYLRVDCWDPKPTQPYLPPEPVDPPPPPPFTPSSVVDVGPGPTGVVRRVRGVVGRHVRP